MLRRVRQGHGIDLQLVVAFLWQVHNEGDLLVKTVGENEIWELLVGVHGNKVGGDPHGLGLFESDGDGVHVQVYHWISMGDTLQAKLIKPLLFPQVAVWESRQTLNLW